jgi:hypothetical protein
MKIGRTIRSYTIEPLENPVPEPPSEDAEQEASDLPFRQLTVSPELTTTVEPRRRGV